MEDQILLNHPAWEKPRLFNHQHAINILELEEKHPSGIYQIAETNSSNAADSSTDKNDTGRKAKSAKASTIKSDKAGK